MPCVAVTDASRPEAAYTASQLGGLAHLPTSSAPTLLLVGHAFEAVLTRGMEPESLNRYPGLRLNCRRCGLSTVETADYRIDAASESESLVTSLGPRPSRTSGVRPRFCDAKRSSLRSTHLTDSRQ